jgi:site-specific recombinase XerD
MPTQSLTLNPAQRVPTTTTLTPAVIDLVQAAKRPNTLAAYRSDLHAFGQWCTQQGLSALPASPETVAAYLADKGSDLHPKTLQRHCASIAQVHRLKGLQSPTQHELVRTCLQGLRAKAATQRPKKQAGRKTKAPALLAEHVRLMLGSIAQETGAGLRDTALLLVGYKAALRRSELAGLQWWQVEWSAEGVLLRLQGSKTDKGSTGQVVALAHEGGVFCPVEALQRWRSWCTENAQISPKTLEEGAVFRSLNKHLQLGQSISAHAVGEIVKQRATAVGLENVTAHSLRRGHLTEGHRRGKTEADLMRTSRHRSVAVFRSYIDEADPFTRATGKGLL